MPYAFEKNIEFENIILRNDNGGSIDLIEAADNANAYISFDSIVLNEDINEPAMFGSLNLTDANNFLDKLSLKPGNEVKLVAKFLEPPPGDTAEEPTPVIFKKTLYFNIIDIKTTTDIANQKVTGGYGTPVKIVIRFASKMFNYLNYQLNDYFGKRDFLGTISNENYEDELLEEAIDADQISVECVTGTVTTNLGSEDDPYIISNKLTTILWNWGQEQPVSFMTQLFKEINKYTGELSPKPLYSHSSYNDVWYKPQNYNYPNFKFAKPPTLINFINYVKEYTILWTEEDVYSQEPAYTPKNPKVDFMFWETMDSFNFKSISKIVEDWGDADPIPFYITPDETDMGAIVSFEVLQDLDMMQLFSEGIFASEYVHVKPNWGNPYRKALSSDEEFTKRLIRYSYIADILEANEGAPVIAKDYDNEDGYSLFRTNDLDPIKFPNNFDTSNFTKTDLNFGYYSKHTFNSDKNIWWEYLSNSPYGYTYNGFYDNPNSGGITLNLTGKIDHTLNRREQEYWQSQFDFSELPGAPLYKILYNIKDKKMEDRKNYHEAKQLKEKWKYYKEKICCERKIPTSFFALLTKAEKIYGGDIDPSQMYTTADRASGKTFADDPGGIYAYDWVEVEFWPRSDVNSILENGEEIVKFENNELFPFVFVKPKGALEGHGIIEKTYKPVQTSNEDPNYKKVNNNESLNKQQLLGKKYLTKDTRAYNLNEVLNTSGLSLQAKEQSVLRSILNKCKTLITNPGITIKLKGNDTDCLTSYPKQFNMMPVGQFRIISDCVNKEKWKFGRIVQINVIPKEIMQTMTKLQDGITSDAAEYSGRKANIVINLDSEKKVTFEPRDTIKTSLSSRNIAQGSYPGIEGNPAYPPQSYDMEEYKRFFNQSPYLFIFDVENAHDGLCDGVCPVV